MNNVCILSPEEIPLPEYNIKHVRGFTLSLYLLMKEKQTEFVGSEVFTAVGMKISIFWGITQWIPLKVNRYFGVTCHLHLQVREISHARNQCEAGSKQKLLHAGFLLGLLFDPADGGDISLRNVP